MTTDPSNFLDAVVGRRHLHVVHGGCGEPPIVFLHGMGTSAATWHACMRLLATRHRVFAPDLIGHGSSPVPDDASAYTRDGTLDDIDDLLADVARRAPATSDGRAVLVGHSLGGYLALAYAATRPGAVRGVVVLNTGPGYRDAEKRDAWNERSRRNAHRFGVPLQVADLNLQHDSVVMDRLAEIVTPVLALAGGDDRPEYAVSGEYLARKMPAARFVGIAGGGHSMHEDTHAAEVSAVIADFVAGLDAST